MVKVHRALVERVGAPAVLLDTPYGFQENADDITARAQQYFSEAVGSPIEAAAWRTPDDNTVDRERALARVAAARYVFAGPGSPTYALRVWNGTPLRDALLGVLESGGGVTFASAAALTLGLLTVPVYEVYKVGEDPAWRAGLDVLGAIGLRAAVIPHYDNAEGGTHDTRYCYLGEPRLAYLEQRLPDEVGVLGVDEHTAAVLDLHDGVVRVLGKGVLSVRHGGTTRTFAAGETLALSDLSDLLRGADVAPRPDVAGRVGRVGAPRSPGDDVAASVRDEADRARAAFDVALSRQDVQACVSAVLGLEATIAAWRADTLQSGDLDEARRVLRALVVRLGELAVDGARDPRERIGPYVDLLLDLRTSARDAKDFATSDLVRDRLGDLGVEVRDTPSGPAWDLDDM
jgi:hypothetical protein